MPLLLYQPSCVTSQTEIYSSIPCTFPLQEGARLESVRSELKYSSLGVRAGSWQESKLLVELRCTRDYEWEHCLICRGMLFQIVKVDSAVLWELRTSEADLSD